MDRSKKNIYVSIIMALNLSIRLILSERNKQTRIIYNESYGSIKWHSGHLRELNAWLLGPPTHRSYSIGSQGTDAASCTHFTSKQLHRFNKQVLKPIVSTLRRHRYVGPVIDLLQRQKTDAVHYSP